MRRTDHLLAVGARLVEELNGGDEHGQTETADEDVEYTGNITEGEGTL